MIHTNINQIDFSSITPNPAIGQLLLRTIGGVHSKMSNISLYFYNSLITKDQYPKISKLYKTINKTEMYHLELLATCCFKLGVDPRLWDCQNDYLNYWSPGYNVYPYMLPQMLQNSINEELTAIQQFQYLIEHIHDHTILQLLENIVLDEKDHLKIFERKLKE